MLTALLLCGELGILRSPRKPASCLCLAAADLLPDADLFLNFDRPPLGLMRAASVFINGTYSCSWAGSITKWPNYACLLKSDAEFITYSTSRW